MLRPYEMGVFHLKKVNLKFRLIGSLLSLLFENFF
jgi:hypothetical protein